MTGTDLSQIQPLSAAPSNCTFVQDDVEDEWIFAQAFDYVHLRMMMMSFDDHCAVMRKVFEHLVPGGWVEYQEGSLDFVDHAREEGGSGEVVASKEAYERWIGLVRDGARRNGKVERAGDGRIRC